MSIRQTVTRRFCWRKELTDGIGNYRTDQDDEYEYRYVERVNMLEMEIEKKKKKKKLTILLNLCPLVLFPPLGMSHFQKKLHNGFLIVAY